MLIFSNLNTIQWILDHTAILTPDSLTSSSLTTVTIFEDQREQLDLPDRTPALSKLFYGCLKHTLNLLSRVLQLVDVALLRPLLSTNQPTVHFRRLADVTNFTELTKAYTQLALDLMQLIQSVSNKTNKVWVFVWQCHNDIYWSNSYL